MAPLLQGSQATLCTEAKLGSQCPHEKLGLGPSSLLGFIPKRPVCVEGAEKTHIPLPEIKPRLPKAPLLVSTGIPLP